MSDLDKLDLKILSQLQKNGRVSITELAEHIGLSASACAERVRRLERDKVITGYHARVSPTAVGKTLLVFVEIKLTTKSEEIFERVKQELLLVPEVMECHLVSGEFDYLVKFRLRGMEEYRQLLGTILKRLPVPAQSHSYVVMEEIKDDLSLQLG
ncbi:winged helix-turn-helix transcriptional regulator [Acidovorax sp. Be4]|uniref:Winged helix-turn-helix transcriptional regulator n=1 Tax=Acidovorax bellezanensis TaxID=2976702 RepID=A0ABT2PL65_9BURK|nr:winged helix-turn-helix transcriptional regulator [Acidovorax sp. Be4]MCT9810965.1 winged helix-turn-helix transcriptional regulator [Acidovorax sp. Be4]